LDRKILKTRERLEKTKMFYQQEEQDRNINEIAKLAMTTGSQSIFF